MRFEDFCMKMDLLEEFDLVITEHSSLNEGNLDNLDSETVIMTGLDQIKSQDVKALVGSLPIVANLMGKKVRDIIKLFSNDGFKKIRGFIDNDIIGSEEVKYMIRMKNDPKRYKGYSGLEQYIRDMKEDNPKILDSLEKAITRILA